MSSSPPLVKSSQTLNDSDAGILPAMTSTPSPTPVDQTSAMTPEGDEGGKVSASLPKVNGGTDLEPNKSDFGELGSLDIDVDLLTTSVLPDDPFAPLPNTSNSIQLASS